MNLSDDWWKPEDMQLSYYEGWDLFECSGSVDGPVQLQKLDEPDNNGASFETDFEAWLFVRGRAAEGSERHQRALGILKEDNPAEYERIMGGMTRVFAHSWKSMDHDDEPRDQHVDLGGGWWAAVGPDNRDGRERWTWDLHDGWLYQDPDTGAESEVASGVCDTESAAKAAALAAYANHTNRTCRHCSRSITKRNGKWIDPEATGDDSVWRETCDAHDTFTAEHEPTEEPST